VLDLHKPVYQLKIIVERPRLSGSISLEFQFLNCAGVPHVHRFPRNWTLPSSDGFAASRAASYLSLIAPPAPTTRCKAGIAALVEQLRDVAVI